MQGLDKVLKGFGNLSRGMQNLIIQTTKKALWELLTPVKEWPWPVKTGRSRSSLGAAVSHTFRGKPAPGIYEVKTLGGELVGRIGSSVVYVPYIEKRLHIMENVTKASAPRVVKQFEDALDKVLEDNL